MGLVASTLTYQVGATRGARLTIGAIRWDAWYTQSTTDGIRSVVQKTLGPERWHDRAPSCAVVGAQDKVSFDNCGNQSRINSEILAAHNAKIDYWAYCWFGPTHPMQQAWRLHQTSPYAKLVNWSLVFSYGPFVTQASTIMPELTGYLKRANYQSVLDSRPLLFLLNDKTDLSILANGIRQFRHGCRQAGAQNPYVVLMLSSPTRGVLSVTGADAVSAYEKAGPTPVAGNYAELVTIAENYWTTLAGTGQAIVPTAMTGWDTRPRQETSTPWPTNPRGPSGEEHYFAPGTAEQIAAHVRNMASWIRKNPQSCPAQTGIIYSWDEHDEGGSTLNPTLGRGDSILTAVGQYLE